MSTTASPPAAPTTTSTPTAERPWYPCLDGLRGLAAFLVVVFHVTGAVAIWTDWTLGAWLVRLGNVGVALFFVLSGFLLARPFFAAHLDGRPAPRVGPYALRRVARIVPAFWVALTVWLFLVRDPRPAGQGDPYLLFYGFGQIYRAGYVDGNGALAVAWTLCIEITFYAVLPALSWLLCRLADRGSTAHKVRVLAWSCIALFALGSLLRWWLLTRPKGDVNWPLMAFWLPGHIGWFGAGMALAAVSVGAAMGVRPPRVVRDLASVPAVPLALALGVFWLVTLRLGARPVQGDPLTAWELFVVFVANGVIGMLAVTPFVVGDQRIGPLRNVLASPPARWLGEISYGLYLWHTIVLYQVNKWVASDAMPGGTLARLLVVMVLSVALAQASWTFLERPIQNAASRLAARL